MRVRAAKRGIAIFAVVLLACAGYLGLRGLTQPAPDVIFVSLQGEKISTAQLRGKVAIVNFWATDCVPCRKELPQLIQTYQRYRGQGLELIAVAMRHDPPNFVIGYAERNRLPFKVALDPMGELARSFGDVQVTPTMVVIDKRGRILQQVQGEPDFDALHRLLERSLAEAA
ncbi:MAG: TlpA disulfide reductase family protein [Rhodospirillaceae bacterium]